MATIRDDSPIVGRQQAGALGAEHDFVPCLIEILHRHVGPIVPRRAQCRFVAEIGEIRAAEPGGRTSQSLEADIGSSVKVTDVNPKDAFPAAPVRKRHHDLSIETAWAQKRRVEHIETIGRGQEDHLLVFGEASISTRS